MTVKRRRYGRSGYGYSVDGEKVPGVTKILGMLPKDNLIEWAARESADHAVNYWAELSALLPMERHQRILKARYNTSQPAAKRGTEVHRLAEALNNDEEVTVPEDLAGYVDAYRDFLDAMRVRPLIGGTELVVASRTHRYCGTADAVADLGPVMYDHIKIGACRWLLELKTTRSGVWPESALQACAYEHAEVFVDPADPEDERKVEWLGIERCGVVHLSMDGWELRPVETGDATWEMFLHLRWLHDHQDEMPLWVGGAALPAEITPAVTPVTTE